MQKVQKEVNNKVEFAVVCKERCKGFPDAIYVCKRGDESSINLIFLGLRARYNPELSYYLTKVSTETPDEEVVAIAKGTRFSDKLFVEIP